MIIVAQNTGNQLGDWYVTSTISLSDSFVRNIVKNKSFTDILLPVQTITYSTNNLASLSSPLILTQTISTNQIHYKTLLSTLSLTHSPNDLSQQSTIIIFTSLNQSYTISVFDSLIQFPYSNIDIPIYRSAVYTLLTSNLSRAALFNLTLTLTHLQRREVYEFFHYFRCNQFLIQIQNDFWEGYITTNNNELLNAQFDNIDSTITIQFEAYQRDQ